MASALGKEFLDIQANYRVWITLKLLRDMITCSQIKALACTSLLLFLQECNRHETNPVRCVNNLVQNNTWLFTFSLHQEFDANMKIATKAGFNWQFSHFVNLVFRNYLVQQLKKIRLIYASTSWFLHRHWQITCVRAWRTRNQKFANCRISLFLNNYAQGHTFSFSWVCETTLRN